MTTELLENQTDTESRIAFFKQQIFEANAATEKARLRFLELTRLEIEARNRVIEAIAGMAELSPLQSSVENLIAVFKSEVNRMNELLQRLSRHENLTPGQ